MHPQIHKSLLRYEPHSHANFIERQFRELRRSLWALMGDKKWIDDPWKIQRAEGKIFQLAMAANVGLDIPDTVVTSDPEEVRRFYADHHGKIVSNIVVPAPILDHVIYTNPVTEDQMIGIDSVKMCPSIFQEEVLKSYELRITVVGDRVFAARIDSQDDEETKIDWRRKPVLNDHAVSFSPCKIPDDITQKIYRFMVKMGLRFGCIDMIVTPDGKYVFLEINPNGQWYFVQLKTKMDIATSIVELVL
jgi:glutathione synthase/RimK-type ligase-like ATP-grasp enzyme